MKLNLKLYFVHFYHSFFKSQGTPGRLSPKRFLTMSIIFLVYPLWHFGIRLAYLLDNIFYPEHLNQEVAQPIFIVGNFRSGTTFLHRLLSKDEGATSMKAWEIFVAPSITQRHFYQLVMRLNRYIGNPIGRLIQFVEQILATYSHIHNIKLTEPEEDAQVLLHIWSTYDLIAFFPFPNLLKKYIYYDALVSDEDKARDMGYYYDVLRKHVFASGGKRLISKNPTNSPKVRSLHRQFPDAKFINIVRNPLRVIPSSISLFSAHWKTYGDPETDYALQDTVIEHSKYWYRYPHRYLKRIPANQYVLVNYRNLVKDPQGTIERIYAQFGMEISPQFAQILETETEKAKAFKSKHQYSLQAMGLSRRRIFREFAHARQQYNFEFSEENN
jgi:omega-hydroxy-beta-dihydromenaquinone-9 sulfotransferase